MGSLTMTGQVPNLWSMSAAMTSNGRWLPWQRDRRPGVFAASA
jgi:hypothetical protein